MVGFVVIGPILLAAAGIVQSVGATRAASDFVNLAPEQTRSFSQFRSQVARDPNGIDKVTIYTQPNSLEVQQTDDSFYIVQRYPDEAEAGLSGDLDKAQVDHDSDSDGLAGDARAIHETDDSGALKAAQGLVLPGLLGLIVAMAYVSLQALRTGLLTRFVGSLGVGLGVAAIFIPPLVLLPAVLWAGYLGYPRPGVHRPGAGRAPPAWAAGEAIPWPRPGDDESPPRPCRAVTRSRARRPRSRRAVTPPKAHRPPSPAPAGKSASGVADRIKPPLAG
jgi:hypothetical protein